MERDSSLDDLQSLIEAIKSSEKIHCFTSELLKGVELVLESVMKLCKVYSQTVNWNLCSEIADKDSCGLDNKEAAHLNHVVYIIKYTIEKLSEVGTLAADSGGNLVTILNLSWKGVVSLLQLGEGALAVKINIGEIILILISMATDSLKCAAESWCTSFDQMISVSESKRVFLPIKFYLINAIRISSQYPHQAFSVYQEITFCVLLLTTLRVTFSREKNLKNICEAMEEHLKPTSVHLLKSLLNSTQLNKDQKLKILDWLFTEKSGLLFSSTGHGTDIQKGLLDDIFSITCEAMSTARILLLGRVSLFMDLLKISHGLEENVTLGITRKLQWCLDVLVAEEVYSSALVLQIPSSLADGKSLVLTWEPLLVSIVHAMKIFMIVAAGTQAWCEVELFLLDNFFHPHFLCWEIVMELWCFLVRHAEDTTIDAVIDKLCSLYNMIANSDSLASLHCTLRKMARSMCLLLASCTTSVVDRVYSFIMTDVRSHLSAVMFAALLLEGFQLDLLSNNVRIAATERIFNEYIHFVDDYVERPLNCCSSDAFGAPVAALCSGLQSMQIDASGIDKKAMKFLLAVIQTYKTSIDRITKNHCCRLLSEALRIISTAKHLYGNDQMEDIIIKLKDMFISEPTGKESELQKCKPALASFLSSLGHMEMSESEENIKTSAVSQLYHMLLRERNWALSHLAISAFGYFAARTSCTQLWRFVPPDAALSFDLKTGSNANGERFMSELKVFLDKEAALPAATASTSDQFELVLKDGLILKELFQRNSDFVVDGIGCDNMETDHETISNKRRKLPDGISRGMELLHNGLRIIGKGLSVWQQDQLHYVKLDETILTQFSRLEDMVNQLAGLADRGVRIVPLEVSKQEQELVMSPCDSTLLNLLM
ncbi:putative F-box only protein 9, partial [Bienertia sinuspersici]